MVKETYLINEAAKEVHVESHVLRYWEDELGLPIKRNPQGHRIYTREDIDKFIKIKNLKDKGLQLRAVKTFLSDNPFAQKQLTKISKAAVESTQDIPHESGYDAGNCGGADGNDANQGNMQRKKNMIEIKSIKSVVKPKNEVSGVKAATEEQTQRLQYLFQKLVKEAVAENNEEIINRIVGRISDSVKDDVCKELDYQFRLFEERDEERMANRMSMEDKRSEEYYKRIDELLSKYRGKGRFAKKEKEKEKEEKTISFPLTGKEKEPKPKKEFRLFKKTPEAKFQ